jgi:hypothetical protein
VERFRSLLPLTFWETGFQLVPPFARTYSAMASQTRSAVISSSGSSTVYVHPGAHVSFVVVWW